MGIIRSLWILRGQSRMMKCLKLNCINPATNESQYCRFHINFPSNVGMLMWENGEEEIVSSGEISTIGEARLIQEDSCHETT